VGSGRGPRIYITTCLAFIYEVDMQLLNIMQPFDLSIDIYIHGPHPWIAKLANLFTFLHNRDQVYDALESV
jgi:hypothetical protein